jgi:hypothetical protein
VALSGKSSSPDVAVRLLGAAASVREGDRLPPGHLETRRSMTARCLRHTRRWGRKRLPSPGPRPGYEPGAAVEYALGELEEEA